jgi:hypothetical protein
MTITITAFESLPDRGDWRVIRAFELLRKRCPMEEVDRG